MAAAIQRLGERMVERYGSTPCLVGLRHKAGWDRGSTATGCQLYMRLMWHRSSMLTCDSGHDGPWVHIEAIDVIRTAHFANGVLSVESESRMEDGYMEGYPGTARLECRASIPGGRCGEEVQLPVDEGDIRWV